MFVGNSPATVESGPYAGWMALPQEASRGIELMRALTETQRTVARIHDEVANDIFEGPGLSTSCH